MLNELNDTGSFHTWHEFLDSGVCVCIYSKQNYLFQSAQIWETCQLAPIGCISYDNPNKNTSKVFYTDKQVYTKLI